MRLIKLAVLSLVGSLWPCSSARAQGWDDAAIGARVSLRVVDSLLPPGLARRNAIVGLVAKREPDALYVQITIDDTARISRATITRMAVSRGVSRRRSATHVALLAGVLYTVLPPVGGEYFDREHFRDITVATAIGGLLGAAFPAEKWKRLRP